MEIANGFAKVKILLDAVQDADGVTWRIAGRIEDVPGSEFEFALLAATQDEAIEKAARMVKVSAKGPTDA